MYDEIALGIEVVALNLFVLSLLLLGASNAGIEHHWQWFLIGLAIGDVTGAAVAMCRMKFRG